VCPHFRLIDFLCDCSLKDIFHERAWLKSDIFSVQVSVNCKSVIHTDTLCSSLPDRMHYEVAIFDIYTSSSDNVPAVELQCSSRIQAYCFFHHHCTGYQ